MKRPGGVARFRWASSALLVFAGCGGAQSTLDPAGPAAERIAALFWWMTGGAAIIWLAVVGLTAYSLYASPERHGVRAARFLIVGGGVVFPTVVLAALLAFGLAMLPPLLAPPPEGSLKILVTGEQWWWRIRYLGAEGASVELANEIRLPVGEPVEFRIESRDVIHSFWIPALGGKVDAIPGRVNRLTLEPAKTGVFRGVCAEYCGASHAYMAFTVVVLEKAEFTAWLASQSAPARIDSGPIPSRGRELFLAQGCGACHTVRGTGADGVVGPDLTHVGGRRTLAAGLLGNDADHFRTWITRTGRLKPEALMPDFGMLPSDELVALAAYLESLE
jgi:cytochrome c oxidase subunit II